MSGCWVPGCCTPWVLLFSPAPSWPPALPQLQHHLQRGAPHAAHGPGRVHRLAGQRRQVSPAPVSEGRGGLALGTDTGVTSSPEPVLGGQALCLRLRLGCLPVRPEPGRASSSPRGRPGASSRCSVVGGNVPPPGSGTEPALPSLGTKGARSSACALGPRGAASGSRTRPSSRGTARSPPVSAPRGLLAACGLPPGRGELSLAPVRPVALPPSGEHAALRGPEAGSQSASKGPHSLQMPHRKPVPR